MTKISNYFLKKLEEKQSIFLKKEEFSDITEHLWSQDEFSNNIRRFLNTNTRKIPLLYKSNREQILNMLPGIKENFEYEGINLITLDDVIEVSTGISIEQFGKEYLENRNSIWVAYWGLTIKDKLFPISGFMTTELYFDFEKKVTHIFHNNN